MKIEGGKVIFSTGRVESANAGIIGINPELDLHQGYDGSFASYAAWGPEDEEYKPLTKAEREELADYMIGLWTAFKTGETP